MRLDEARESDNVEDRRSMGPRRMAVGGGGALLILIIAMLFGADPRQLMRMLQPNPAAIPQAGPDGAGGPQPDDEQAVLAKKVLALTEDVWSKELPAQTGVSYSEPVLVLFRDRVDSACGFASAAMGPFYCPADRKLYLDLSFYEDLRTKHGADGDFAQAYVIAHEIGHHVQNLLGTSEKVQAMQGRISKEEYNDLSVRLELQADFYAGVWAHHAHQEMRLLEAGDIEEALNAAQSIGDDRLQMEAQGYVRPETFTHGTSAQRVKWFRKGIMTGDMRQGDTFNTNDL